MPKPETGEVWLVRFPFTDLTTSKLRPAFVLTSHGEDVIVMGIFSRVPPAGRATWVSIDEWHAAFAQTELKKSSVLKAEKIAVIHESIFHKRIGSLPSDLSAQAQVALKNALLVT